MWELALVYSSGKRYFIPLEILDKYVDKKTIAKIKAAAIQAGLTAKTNAETVSIT